MSIALMWFRQDLRCYDNPAFALACNENDIVIPLYILDEHTAPVGGAQKWWLHHSLSSLKANLADRDLFLLLHQGNPLDLIPQLIEQLNITKVYWNRCYEPLVIQRDTLIKNTLRNQDIEVTSTNSHLFNEPWAIKNKSGGHFKVFTPFWRHCLQHINVPAPSIIQNKPKGITAQSDQLVDWDLLPTQPNWASEFPQYWRPGEEGAQKKLTDFIDYHLKGYKINRNIPACDATSKLSPHLHFGEISPWSIWRAIEQAKIETDCDLPSAECFQSEMGWREFSYHLLYHFPALSEQNFRTEFDAFPWKKNHALLTSWQKGQTGYPLIDAGMRELWQTGYMHNRVRMIVASFLTKNLLIDWRIGAEWFLDTLVDADLASNSASWQWVAGSGVDAAPYYRIFNPILQSEKFDPEGIYIKQWVPELARVPNKWIHMPWAASPDELGFLLGNTYPKPIVDHSETRKIALSQYQLIKK